MNSLTRPATNRPTKATIHAIPSGPAGTRATLNFMRSLVREAKKDIRLREFAMSLVRHLPGKDFYGEINTIFMFVRDKIRYIRDIDNIETIATPQKTLEYRQGDCDDQAVLLATLLIMIGHPSRFIAIAIGGSFVHVYVETRLGNRWLGMDPTENQSLGWRPLNATAVMRGDI